MKHGRTRAETADNTADESSQRKLDRPLSPNLSDFVVVPDDFSFDSSGCSLCVVCIIYWSSNYSVVWLAAMAV